MSCLRWLPITLLLFTALATGCREAQDVSFVSSAQVRALPSEVQTSLREELRRRVGTFDNPVDLKDPQATPRHLRKGQAIYQQKCVQCHGVSGDGNGPVAQYLYPRPRDYRRGIFKFTSTPYGSKPARSDLIRTVTSGVRGTSMPDFKLLGKEQIEAVVDYVLYLTHRGELEEQMAMLADFEGQLTAQLVDDENLVGIVLDRWKQAEGERIVPYTPQPVFTAEHVERGRAAFLTKGCSKCHGEDGRGQTPDNLAGNLRDTWGHVTRAADLTSGLLRGGPQPIDIYRRIYSGINGTPMPGFASAFQNEPDTLWDLVAYVLYVSGRRRAGDIPPPGVIAPYVPPETTVDETAAQ